MRDGEEMSADGREGWMMSNESFSMGPGSECMCRDV